MLQRIPLNYYVLAGLLNFITSFVLSIFVFSRNPKSRTNQTFSLWIFTVAGWSLCYFLWLSTEKSYLAEFYLRTLMLFVILIPPTFTHFILTFLKVDYDKRVNLSNYLISILLACTVYSRLLASDIGPFLVFPYWLKPRFLFGVHSIHFFANIIYSHFLMLRAIKRYSGIFKNQVLYIFIGTAIGFSGGALNYLTWYRVPIPPFLNPLVSISVAIATYAIIKYRLMDIKLARQYLAMNLFYGAVASAIFITLAFFLKQWFLGILVVIFFAVLTAPYLHRWMTKFLEPAFLGETYRRWQGLDKFKEADLGYFPTQIAGNAVKGVTKIIGIETASLFILVKNRKEFRPQAQIGLDDEIGEEPIPWVTLPLDSPLIRYFSNSKEPLIKDELTDRTLKRQMQRLYAQVSIPLFVRGELMGIVNLGPKVNEEMYHQEDLKKLTAFCGQVENHLSHALFMEERASFSQELAHDMKNLFTKAIAPTVGSILETKDPQEKEKEFKTLIRQLGYLGQRLEENFDLVSFVVKVIYGKYPLQPGHIAKVITQSTSLYQPSLREKGLSLGLELPKDLPLVLMNKDDILKVFNNLLDNSLKFTPQGGKILIKAETKEGEVLVTFSDTGLGIAKEDLEYIFEPNLKMPEETETGTGLGLVIVRDIIEAHEGKIWVESEPGKGTNFYFTLPYVQG